MTQSELARDKLKYWALIGRAKKVGFKIPDHWMKYGEPPTSHGEITSICLDSIPDKLMSVFERDDVFYSRMLRGK